MSLPMLWIEAPAIVAPGLLGWAQASLVLRGEAAFDATPLPKYQPTLLPPNERRRATSVCRLAFQTAEESIQAYAGNAVQLSAVFATSGGDTEVLNALCTALAQPERMLSPTHFHNSVHNAAAGYWSIATEACGPSNSLSAHDASFSAGLLDAATLCVVEQRPVLLVSYDVQLPEPLHTKRPLLASFSTACVLTPQPTANSLAGLRLSLTASTQDTTMTDAALEALRLGNPAARALPLLHSLACAKAGVIHLPAVSGSALCIESHPCP